MIFNEDLDRSLWLILSGNKGSRERIVDFIGEIPEDLYVQIKKSLLQYCEYLNKNRKVPVGKREVINLSGNIKTSGDMLYWYEIDPIIGTLNLGKSICYLGEEIDAFQMKLYPITLRECKKMTSLDDKSLGEVYFNFFEDYIDDELCLIDCDSTEFSLIKLPFNKTAVTSYESFPYTKNKVRLVDVRNASQDYSVSDLTNKDSLNRLVRARRKKSSR